MVCGAISESFPVLTAKPSSRFAHGKAPARLSVFLKNNTRLQPAWQEIVDFS
jgi:hypothetical protein